MTPLLPGRPIGAARLAVLLLFCSLSVAQPAPVAAQDGAQSDTVPVWGRWERAFTAHASTDPETVFTVTLTAPGGGERTVDGFWDGGLLWRVRFMPDEPGLWRFRTSAEPAVAGLDGLTGSFQAVPAEAGTSFLRHGAVRVAEGGRHLAHADGTPFFWLGDTAWNGALRSEVDDWEAYLADRAEKRFTAVQFVTTQWRAARGDAQGQVAYTGYDDISINPAFFQRLDARVDAVNEAGLLAAPVLLWALGEPDEVPGKLPVDEAIRLARYIVARYQGHHVLWFLGGDENYDRERDRWLAIGRGVFDRPGHAPVTLHPQGMQWHFGPFLDEPWLDLLIYQSGHGDGGETLRWIHQGPPAERWREGRPRPVINSEPPYEDHVAYQSGLPHTAYNVRRAVYWSLLNAPTAGVSYGAHGVWSWETEAAVPLNHEGAGVAKPWHEAMELPGSVHMKHAAALMQSVDWWTLRPDQALLAAQPAGDAPARFVAAARSEDGGLAVLYLPAGGTVTLAADHAAPGEEAFWYDPRTGGRTDASPVGRTFTAPDGQDWVLVLQGGV